MISSRQEIKRNGYSEMRKRNKVKQLNRVTSHRKAMMKNMVTSLFDHERIVTTRARGKVLRTYAEKLITRAKRNLDAELKPEARLHNKREVMKHIHDRDVVVKLFDDIAQRFKERSGGYTRVIHLPEREKDSSKMSIVELVERKEKTTKAPKKTDKAAKGRPPAKSEKAEPKAKEKEPKKKDKDKEGKWYWRFRKKKTGEP